MPIPTGGGRIWPGGRWLARSGRAPGPPRSRRGGAGGGAGGGSWRLASVLAAVAGAVSWLGIATTGPVAESADEADSEDDGGSWPGLRAALRITVRAGAVRWLLLLEASDLLLDVFTGFLALYLVAAAHASAFLAALGVAVRLGAGLAGYALLNPVLERFSPLRVLRVSVLASGVLFPAFLFLPGLALKLVALAALSIATAPWYPVLMAELYASLPGRSGLAVSLSSAAALVGAAGPLVVGLLAQEVGLTWAMVVLCAVPVMMLAAPGHPPRPAARRDSAKLGTRD